MKIVLPVDERSLLSRVNPTLGKTKYFAVIDVVSLGEEYIENAAAADAGGAGVRAAQLIIDTGAKTLITHSCGQNAANVLEKGGIKLYKAEEKSILENIESYKAGLLKELTEIHPGHHKG